MSNSRTQNSIKNSAITFISQVFLIAIKFILQTFFVKMLSTEYLGINGLFTNILTMLSFAELGIGNAIIFSMYRPVAEDDKEKIKSLMNLYKKAYIAVGIIILVLGLILTPFISSLINETPDIAESLQVIYVLFLMNTVISYFFTYKKSIISAYQNEYIITINNLIFNIIRVVLQVFVLVTTHNYILYLIIQITTTFAENAFISWKANKLYPYLKEKNIEKLTRDEQKGIFNNVKHLFIYKIGNVILSGTDNVIISKMIGIIEVGINSNYNLIVTSINGIINKALASITSSIGNLNIKGDKKRNEDVFYQILFISVWIYGFLSIALLCLFNDFIEIWLGKEYIFDFLTVFSIVLSFYVDGVRFAGYTYRTTLGLFEKSRYIPLIAAFINIVLSIVLGKLIGIAGILFATSIARIVTTTWNDPYLIHKYKFENSPFKFYKKYIVYFLIVGINCVICIKTLGFIHLGGIYGFIVKGIVCTIISNAIFFIVFFKTKEFKSIYSRMSELLKGNRKCQKN